MPTQPSDKPQHHPLTELDKLRQDQRAAYQHLTYAVREFLRRTVQRSELRDALIRVEIATNRLARHLPFGTRL